MKAKNRTPIFMLQFCKDNIVKKRQLRFDIAKAALLRCKTYVFTVQLIKENEEKSKLEQTN